MWNSVANHLLFARSSFGRALAAIRAVPGRLGLTCVTFAVSLLVSATTSAQDKGYTWVVDRQTYVLETGGRWVNLVEAERKAHDSQAARNGARIDLTYEATQQTLEMVEALTIKADGRRLQVDPDKVIDIAPKGSQDISFYTDLRTRSIVFPDVEAGDSIRYVYRVVNHKQTWPGYSWNIVWHESNRAIRSERIFDTPSSMRLDAEHHGVGYQIEFPGERVKRTFSWSNPKILNNEAGAISAFDRGPRLAVSTYGSYAEIGEFYAVGHGQAAATTPEIVSLAKRIVGSTIDREAQARLLYDWVVRNIRYVGVAVGDGKLQPVPAEETIRNRYGDCKAQVALLAALLAARDIVGEPVLIDNSFGRYTLPEVPVTIFNHIILYIPELDRYADSTWQYGSFGVLPWGHYGKPVVIAALGKARLARVPFERPEENSALTHVTAVVSADGTVTGTTREVALGTMAGSLRNSGQDVSPAKAAAQLRLFGAAGTGHWSKVSVDPSIAKFELTSEFKLSDRVDLAAGDPLNPPLGVRFLVRPGTFLMGVQEAPRKYPFVCHAGRQVEKIDVTIPSALQPLRLPTDKYWKTSNAEFRATYRFSENTLRINREFLAAPSGPVCQPETSRELIELLSNIRRDLRSTVTFALQP